MGHILALSLGQCPILFWRSTNSTVFPSIDKQQCREGLTFQQDTYWLTSECTEKAHKYAEQRGPAFQRAWTLILQRHHRHIICDARKGYKPHMPWRTFACQELYVYILLVSFEMDELRHGEFFYFCCLCEGASQSTLPKTLLGLWQPCSPFSLGQAEQFTTAGWCCYISCNLYLSIICLLV